MLLEMQAQVGVERGRVQEEVDRYPIEHHPALAGGHQLCHHLPGRRDLLRQRIEDMPRVVGGDEGVEIDVDCGPGFARAPQQREAPPNV